MLAKLNARRARHAARTAAALWLGTLISAVWVSAAAAKEHAQPAPAACRASAAPRVVLERLESTIEEETTFDLDELNRLARERAGLGATEGNNLGFYWAELDSRYRIEGRITETEEGACLDVGTLIVKLGFRSRTIFLAREILPVPCVADRVRAHEREHADVDDRVLDAFLRALERTLPQEIATKSPAFGAEPAEAKAQFRRTVESALGVALELFSTERRRLQVAVHDPYERGHLARACGGDLPAELRQRLR
jgi:hypothetical protein